MTSPAPIPSASAASQSASASNASSPNPAQKPPLQPPPSPKYGGFTRFEIELEFVQSLANPAYLLHLASSTTTISTTVTSNPTVSNQAPTAADPIPSSPAATPGPLLTHAPFIAYLSYLQYWSHPPYTKYLNYPGPTLKHLQLLQNGRFREEILRPEVVGRLMEEGIRSALELHLGGRR